MKVKIEIDCGDSPLSREKGDEVIRILKRYVECYTLDICGITRSLFDEHGKRVGGAWIEQ